MDFNLADEVRRQLEEALSKRGRVNIVIAGRSGVGKSTLVNAVFQGNLAETGQGRPVTQSAREYSKEGLPVTILDTRGLEMDQYLETTRQLEAEVRARSLDADAKRHLHVAWVCLSEDSRRVEQGESAVAEMLARYMPVLGVITKARSDQGFREEVLRLIPVARNAMRVRALREQDDEGHVLEPRGLQELVDVTMDLVPEAQRNAFAAAQKVSVALKRTRAHAIVGSAATLAGTIGATPIPFSDALVIVPVQISMLASISAVFGLPLSQAFLSTLLSSASGGLVATLSGQTIVSGLLKLIPGVGTFVGAAISAATAVAVTTLFGEGYISVLSKLFLRNQGEPPTEEEVAHAFREELHGRSSSRP
ncbi:50S ribosome-binding GTPase [Stigmatella sp. ncwal1]|uniref:50S ribosome-binding GTPase n=1 Tax=Stigmatella ashevillensis TaxID=2995309 RepID=A0ABT5DC31_9BACT|nr:GTPase [Stigmatella ashevillena]MDC0710653.1 50S ribosome-binding GTPase [Stigmatella ashevillena]